MSCDGFAIWIEAHGVQYPLNGTAISETERSPGERRGGTEARIPVGCDHAHTDPDGVAIARDRDQRDGLVSV